MVFPNCSRSVAYVTAASSAAWAMPTQPAATDIRPLASADMAMEKPLPSGAEHRRGGHADVLEDQFGGGLAAQSELAVDGAAGQAGGVGGHEEGGDPLVAGGVGRAGEEQHDVGPGAVGDEHLAAVDDVVVAVAHRPGREVAGVGAGARLGEAEAADVRAGGEPRQPLPLLLLAPPGRDGLGDEAEGDRDDAAHRGVAAAELLRHQAVREVVAAGSAVLLVDGEAQEADVAELLHDRAVDLLRPVPGDDVRGDLPVDEVPGEPSDGGLLLAEPQVHDESSRSKAT